MEILLSIFLLYSFIALIFANCNVQKYYSLEGKQNFSLNNNSTCSNNSDNCAYLIANIPEFFFGQYQDCSSNIFDFLTTKLYDLRPDLKTELENNQFIDEAKKNCNKNMPSNISGKLFPGNYTIFISCSGAGTNPSLDNAPNIPPVPGTITPATCSLGNEKKKLCTEGYCTVFEYSINNTETLTTSTGQYYGCPNGLYDFMSNLVEKDSNIGADYDIVQKLSTNCVNKINNTLAGSLTNYQYFYYINCNSDGDVVTTNIPQLPPKLSSSKTKECPYEITGFFANQTNHVENKTIYCNDGYCAYVEAKVLNINGKFQGCPSSIENIITEINKETKGVLNGTINEFVTQCQKQKYKNVDIANVLKLYMDCYDGDHPDMSGKNPSSTNKISLLSLALFIAFFFRYV